MAPAATLTPQLLAKTKDEVSAPVSVMLVIDNAVLPLLVSVTVCELLDEPISNEPNERFAAERETVCDAMPVPFSAID